MFKIGDNGEDIKFEFEFIFMSRVMTKDNTLVDNIYFRYLDFESESEAFKKWLESNVPDVKRWGDYFTIDTKEIMRIKPI